MSNKDYKKLYLVTDYRIPFNELLEKTKEALMRFQKEGGKVVLASGRPTYGMKTLEEELELKRYGGYLMSFNGGQLYECATGNLLQLINH